MAGGDRLGREVFFQGIEIIEGQVVSEATNEEPIEPPIGTVTEDSC